MMPRALMPSLAAYTSVDSQTVMLEMLKRSISPKGTGTVFTLERSLLTCVKEP